MEWLQKCFEPTTREKANGATRLLIYDGHGSHVTGPFLSLTTLGMDVHFVKTCLIAFKLLFLRQLTTVVAVCETRQSKDLH